ncbi:MAG: hypothetical protein FD174_1077 [Geobacteraceae bacterium]|nr:MAG: hypothetical protein FD174_1077 [Geobacteraceae bacterium]
MNIITSGSISTASFGQQTRQTALELSFAGQDASLQVDMFQETFTADVVTLSGKTGGDAQTGHIASKALKTGGLSPLERQQELFSSIIEKLTGKHVKNLEAHGHEHDDAEESSLPTVQSGAVTGTQGFELSQASLSVATVSFSAEGSVRTADGHELSFSFELSMSRASLAAQSLSVQNASADGRPLVVDYSGTAAELTSRSFSFSFSLDGTDEGAAEKTGHGSIKFEKPLLNLLKQASKLMGYDNGDERLDKVARSFFA